VMSISAGAGVGFVTGFLGVGGGFLVVPALVAFAGLDMRQAVGTSLLVIAINSAAGFVGHLGGDQMNFGLIGLLTFAAAAGSLAGERLARGVSTTKLRRTFGLLVIAVSLTIMIASTISANEVRPRAQNAQFLRGAAQTPSRKPDLPLGAMLATPTTAYADRLEHGSCRCVSNGLLSHRFSARTTVYRGGCHESERRKS
jgi:hypothetical protein